MGIVGGEILMTNREFILRGLRAATLRARLLAFDIDAIEISLERDMIDAEHAYKLFCDAVGLFLKKQNRTLQ